MDREFKFIFRFKNQAGGPLKDAKGKMISLAKATKVFATNLKRGTINLRAMLTILSQVSKKMGVFGRRMREAGTLATGALTLPIVALGAGILKTAGSFEQAFNQIQAATGKTLDQLTEVRAVAKELGATTAFTATQAAEGFLLLGKAGLEVHEQLDAIRPALNLAAAGTISLGQASAITTSVLRGFSLQSKDIKDAVDILANTARNTKTDITGLGNAYTFVATQATQLDQSLLDTSVALGAIANAGIPASRAGRNLSAAFQSLSAPTNQGRKAIQDLGLEVFDTEGKFKSIIEIAKDLRAKTKDLSTEAKAAVFGDIFSKQGARAIGALVAQADSLDTLKAKIADFGGAAEEAAKAQLKGLFGALRELKSAVEDFAIEIGDSGLLKRVTAMARSFTEWIRTLDGTNAKVVNTVVVILSLLAVVGPLLVAVGLITIAMGAMANATGNAIKALATLWRVIAAKVIPTILSLNIAMLANPFVIIGTTIAILIGLYVKFRKTVVTWGDETFRVMDVLGAVFDIWKERVVKNFTIIADFFKRFSIDLSGIFDFISLDFSFVGKVFKAVGNGIIKTMQLIVLTIKTGFTVIGIFLKNLVGIVGDFLKPLLLPLQVIGDALVNVFTKVGGFIGGVFSKLADVTGKFFGDVGNDLKTLAKNVDFDFGGLLDNLIPPELEGEGFGARLVEGIPTALREGLAEGRAIIASDPLGEAFEAVAKRAGDRYKASLPEGAKEGLEAAKEVLSGSEGDETVKVAKTLGQRIGDALALGFKNFTKGFKDASDEFVTTSRNATEQGAQLFKSFADSSQEAIKGFITEGKFDIKSIGTAVLDTISDILAQRITGGIAAAIFGEPATGDVKGTGKGTGGLLGAAGGLFGSLFKGGGGGEEVGSGVGEANTDILGGLLSQTDSLNAATEAATVTTGGFFSSLSSTFTGLFDTLSTGLTSLFSGGGGEGGGGLFGIIGGLVKTGVGAALGGGAGSVTSAPTGIGGAAGFTITRGAAMGGITGDGPNAIQGIASMSKGQRNRANKRRFRTGGITDSIPAMLSPGEAVVPLPDGRRIPVDMKGAQGSSTTINFNLPPGTDVDSFRESQAQIGAAMARTVNKANARNT